MRIFTCFLAALIAIPVIVNTAGAMQEPPHSCTSKVLQEHHAGWPPAIPAWDDWDMDCSGDSCCDKQGGSSIELGDYTFCACDENEPVCCHVVMKTDTGVGTGKAKVGDCSAQNAGCPTGNACRVMPDTVEPPWTGGWKASCITA